MLIFEDEAEKGVHLLRNSPGAWLQKGKELRVRNAETYFGPMSYQVSSPDGQRLEAWIEPPQRERLDWIRL